MCILCLNNIGMEAGVTWKIAFITGMQDTALYPPMHDINFLIQF